MFPTPGVVEGGVLRVGGVFIVTCDTCHLRSLSVIGVTMVTLSSDVTIVTCDMCLLTDHKRAIAPRRRYHSVIGAGAILTHSPLLEAVRGHHTWSEGPNMTHMP